MKRRSYYLPDEQIEKLGQIKRKTGISVAELIRRAVDFYLERVKSQGR